MLGHLVKQYLDGAGITTITSDLRYTGEPADPLIQAAVSSNADVVVNCAAIIPQRGPMDVSMFLTNTVLPQHLAAALSPGQLLVHPSTDCVFDGRRGSYTLGDAPDAVDPYGLSKRLAELALAARATNVVVLRTSIVGPEISSSRGLLAWFLNQAGPLKGWTDHRWNGITTLAWAELCLEIARGASVGPGIHHVTTEAVVSKFELLSIFARVFERPIEIEPVASKAPVDRSLTPSHAMAPLEEQLRALREWMARPSE